MVAKLERLWRDVTGRPHVVACRSGSVALRLAVASLEIEPGSEVIVPATAVHIARSLFSSGLVAVPVDLHPRTLQMDPAAVEQAITPRTAAVVAVDQHGTTADYRQLAALGQRYGVAVVEDGTQSLGAVFDHLPVGSHGHISVCALPSQNQASSLGTAGLVATDNDRLAALAHRLLLVDSDDSSSAPGGPSHPLAGWSCRLAELDASIGAAQLRATHAELGVRCTNGAHLRNRLAPTCGLWLPDLVRGASHVYTSFPLVVQPDELGLPEAVATALRDTVIDCLAAEGLVVDKWQPQPAVAALGVGLAAAKRTGLWPTARRQGALPVVEALAASALVLGMRRSPFGSPNTVATMDQIADCFAKVLIDNVDRLRQLTMERSLGRYVA